MTITEMRAKLYFIKRGIPEDEINAKTLGSLKQWSERGRKPMEGQIPCKISNFIKVYHISQTALIEDYQIQQRKEVNQFYRGLKKKDKKFLFKKIK